MWLAVDGHIFFVRSYGCGKENLYVYDLGFGKSLLKGQAKRPNLFAKFFSFY